MSSVAVRLVSRSSVRPARSALPTAGPGRALTGRWEPTRENVMMVLRKSYLTFAETTQDMVKTAAPKTNPKIRVKWLRYVLLGVVGFGIYHILSGPSGALNLMQLRKTNARYVDELDSLAVRKQELEIEKRRLLHDSAYIERVARKELGMAKPGEKVFRFIPPSKPKGKGDGG